MSYVGGPGYELYVTTDQCLTLYEALWSVGDEFGLKDAGYYTIDALRIEAGRRAWGAELIAGRNAVASGARLRREDGQAHRRSSAATRWPTQRH
jgi:4-methylaminobutanoate oxidase (formaldehyde-forming)